MAVATGSTVVVDTETAAGVVTGVVEAGDEDEDGAGTWVDEGEGVKGMIC